MNTVDKQQIEGWLGLKLFHSRPLVSEQSQELGHSVILIHLEHVKGNTGRENVSSLLIAERQIRTFVLVGCERLLRWISYTCSDISMSTSSFLMPIQTRFPLSCCAMLARSLSVKLPNSYQENKERWGLWILTSKWTQWMDIPFAYFKAVQVCVHEYELKGWTIMDYLSYSSTCL